MLIMEPKMQVVDKTLLAEVTSQSLSVGFIPKRCPICGNSTDRLVVHHWGERKVNLANGTYRRMCLSCNGSLGVIFKGEYPTWEKQLEELSLLIRQYPNTYPSFTGREEEWSQLLDIEIPLLKYIIEGEGIKYKVDFSGMKKFFGENPGVVLVSAGSPYGAFKKAFTELGLGVKYSPRKIEAFVSVEKLSSRIKSKGGRTAVISTKGFIERAMKVALGIENEDLRIKMVNILLEARKELNGTGREGFDSSES